VSRRLAVIAAIVVLVAGGGYLGVHFLWQKAKTALSYDHCTIGSYDLDTDQAVVAAEMVGAVTSYRPALPQRAAVLVLAAGLQESKLTNLAPGAGDRDSVGVLQQRPSQGWGRPAGNAASLNDVFEATTEFLAHLRAVPHWQRLSLAAAVQAVQISADGSAYAQHEPEAQALADGLQGHVRRGITCSFGRPTEVATPARVATLVTRDLPVNTPSTGADTVTVPGAGWQTAAWFVANADRLGIDQVSYAGSRWSREHGWQDDTAAGKQAVVATRAQLR